MDQKNEVGGWKVGLFCLMFVRFFICLSIFHINNIKSKLYLRCLRFKYTTDFFRLCPNISDRDKQGIQRPTACMQGLTVLHFDISEVK